MKAVKVKTEQAVDTIQNFIINQQHGVAYCVHDKQCIFCTDLATINEEVCTQYNYAILNTMHNGGVVVVNKGDISVVHFGEICNDWMHKFASYLIEQYKNRGLNASFDGNDILIDGYKISGLSATPYKHLQYSTIHIGINTNLEHIEQICRKPMEKIPKGLSEYNLTTEEIEAMVLDFCLQQFI